MSHRAVAAKIALVVTSLSKEPACSSQISCTELQLRQNRLHGRPLKFSRTTAEDHYYILSIHMQQKKVTETCLKAL